MSAIHPLPLLKAFRKGRFFIVWRGGRTMAAETVYDYYYGDESSQFSFYRIPRQLIMRCNV